MKGNCVTMSAMDLATTPPDLPDATSLEELESKVANGLALIKLTYYVVGMALREINERGLYKERGYERFADYAEAQFQLSYSDAYATIQKAEVAHNVPELRSAPASHAAALLGLPSETQREVVTLIELLGYGRPSKRTAEDIKSFRIIFSGLLSTPVLDDETGEVRLLSELSSDQRIAYIVNNSHLVTDERKKRQGAHIEEKERVKGFVRLSLDDPDAVIDALFANYDLAAMRFIAKGIANEIARRERTVEA